MDVKKIFLSSGSFSATEGCEKGYFMKGGFIRKLAAGMLAAAMVVTLTPGVTAGPITAKADLNVGGGASSAMIRSLEKTVNSIYFFVDFPNGHMNPGKAYPSDVFGGIFVNSGNEFGLKYNLTSSSKNFSYNSKTGYITAKKTGSYKITLSAKNKRGRRGSVSLKLKVSNPKIKKGRKSLTRFAGDDVRVYNCVSKDWDYEGDGKSGAKYKITKGKGTVLSGKKGFYTAKKAGTAKVKVMNYYGANLGTITVKVKNNNVTGIKAKKGGNISTQVGKSVNVSSYFKVATSKNPGGVSSQNSPKAVTVKSADTNIFTVSKKSGKWTGKAKAVGSTTLTVSVSGKTLEIPVTVAEVPQNHCTGLSIDEDEAYYYDDDDNEVTGIKLYAGGNDYRLSNYYDMETSIEDDDNVIDPVEAKVADESIAKVTYHQEDEDYYEGWYIEGLNAGDTTVTITCNGHSLDIPVHVEEY